MNRKNTSSKWSITKIVPLKSYTIAIDNRKSIDGLIGIKRAKAIMDRCRHHYKTMYIGYTKIDSFSNKDVMSAVKKRIDGDKNHDRPDHVVVIATSLGKSMKDIETACINYIQPNISRNKQLSSNIKDIDLESNCALYIRLWRSEYPL